jgi:hypothetical protein
MGGGGLKNAVADRGDEEAAGFAGARKLFDEDLEKGERAVGGGRELGEEGLEVGGGVVGEPLDGDAVHASAALVVEDAVPGGLEVGEGEGGRHGAVWG